MKKIWVILLLILTLVVTGCTQTTSSITLSNDDINIPSQITLANEETVNLIELLDLEENGVTYTLKSNSASNLVCSNDGTVTTVRTGTNYKITLTIKKGSQTITKEIKVIVKDYQINGINDEENIYKGKESSYTLSLTNSSNVEYSYSITSGTGITASIEGNNLVINGTLDETVVITLKAISGTIVKTREVTLKSTRSENVKVKLLENQIAVFDNSSTISAKVTKDGVELTGETIEFISSDESIVTVDNDGNITKVASNGVAQIYAKVTHNEVEYFSNKATCIVFTEQSVNFANNNDSISIYGRCAIDNGALVLDETNCGFELYFYGSKLDATFKETRAKLRIVVDGIERTEIITDYTINLATFKTAGVHRIYVAKATSSERGKATLKSLSGAEYYSKVEEKQYKFLFLGDSITVGHGVNADGTGDTATNEDGTKTWAALVREHFDANSQTIAKNGISVGAKVNCSELMYEIYDCYSYTNRTKYNMSDFVPDLIMINLGTNDATALYYPGTGCASANPSGQDVINGYTTLINRLKNYYPDAKIICIYGMMGNHDKVDDAIEEAVSTLNKTYDNSIYYISMSDVSCKGNGNHPDLKGQEQGANVVIKYIESNNLLD